MRLSEHMFENRALASKAGANAVRDAIMRDLAVQAESAIVISGGSTPEECFRLLAHTVLAWQRVRILMSDERCVRPGHPASNEGMIRRLLLTHCAAEAHLFSLYKSKLSPAGQCALLSEEIGRMPLPFSISMLGMGEDGHFASLFPDFDLLSTGLDTNGASRCLPVQTEASPHPRITLTMSTLIQSREILLMFFGDAKRKIFEQAKRSGSNYPVSALLHQDRTPVRVIWAP